MKQENKSRERNDVPYINQLLRAGAIDSSEASEMYLQSRKYRRTE